MKLVFPPKKFQITYALRGASFGLVLSLVLYVYYLWASSIPLISESFVGLLLLGITSFVWLISYVSVGTLLPFVVSAHNESDPSLWVIMVSPVLFYSVIFWFLGSTIWMIRNYFKNRTQIGRI